MKICEMTMRGPDLSLQAEKFVNRNKNRWLNHGTYIGDIEDYKILKDGIYYSLWNYDILVAVCSLSDDENVVDDVYVNSDYRGKKIFSMLLWFFKTRLNRSSLILGQVHSSLMQEVVKGLTRFEKNWINIKTGEKKPFSLDTMDQFYSNLQPTEWRLILENSGDFNWPLFNKGGFVLESYASYID